MLHKSIYEQCCSKELCRERGGPMEVEICHDRGNDDSADSDGIQ